MRERKETLPVGLLRPFAPLAPAYTSVSTSSSPFPTKTTSSGASRLARSSRYAASVDHLG